MQAAVLDRFDQPLTVRAVDDPEAGPGEVVLRTRAAGVCRTDLKIVAGGIPTVAPPLVLGHEIAGEVATVGRGVTGVRLGDRVLAGLDVSCGTCHYCRVGELDHCASLRRLGIEEDGGLAEAVRVPAANLVPLPDEVGFAAAATIADAVGSPYHALVRLARIEAGQTVAVYGLGGLGLSAVQIAHAAGARVIGIARTPARRELAEELGAFATLDPDEGPLAAGVQDLTGGLGVDVFLDIVGIEGSAEVGVASCRTGGTVVVLGYVVPELVVPQTSVVLREVVVRGSRGSTRRDLHQVVRLVADGRVDPVIGARFGLDEVNDALDGLRAGDIIGRAVVELP